MKVIIAMKSLRFAVSVLAFASLFSAPCFGAQSGRILEQKGWSALWSNRFDEARSDFLAQVKSDPSDANAYLGLSLLDEEEDKVDLELTHIVSIYKSDPASPAAANRWRDLVDLSEQRGRADMLSSAAKYVVASKKTSPELREAAKIVLSQAANHKNVQTLGIVKNWDVIGPFSNSCKSGFEKEFEPEYKINLSKSVVGKNGIAYAWQPLKAIDAIGVGYVSDALSTQQESEVFYAATAVYSKENASATLYAQISGASKVFVNGEPVISDPLYRAMLDYGTEDLKASVRLKAGWNTILVKIATDNDPDTNDSEDDTDTNQSSKYSLGGSVARFRIRFAAQSGEPIDLQSNPSKAQTLLTGIHRHSIDADGAEGSASTNKFEDPAIGDVAEADTFTYAHDFDSAITSYKAALAVHPDSSIIHIKLSDVYLSNQQYDEAKAEADLAAKLNPRDLSARGMSLEMTYRQFSPQERIERYKSILAINPKSSAMLAELSRTYSEAKLNSDAVSTMRKAYENSSGADSLDNLIQLLSREKRLAEAKKTVAAALKANPNDDSMLKEAVAFAVNSEDPASALKYSRLRLNADPNCYDAIEDVAIALDNLGDLSGSLKAWNQVIAIRPQYVSAKINAADLLVELGSKKSAAALYREALRLDPSQVDLREKIAIVSGNKPEINLAGATDAAPILAHLPKDTDYPGQPAVILLNEERRVVYPDGGVLARAHVITKIFDKSGVALFSYIDLNNESRSTNVTVESARIIKADGKVQDFTKDAYTYLQFPSLAPGDTIDYSYRLTDCATGGLSGQFWSEWQVDFPVPVKQSRYSLITPTNKPFQIKLHNGAPEPIKKDAGDWTITTWNADNVAPLKNEQAAPPMRDVQKWVDISSVSDWKTIVDWYLDLSSTRCIPDKAITEKTAEITKDAKTSTEKLKAIVSYVRSIKYQSSPFRMSAYVPTEGKKVIRDRYGDCKDKAALITAMLTSVGIKSEMVLLSPRNEGITPFLPSSRFAHAIARVQTENGPMFVDATADSLAFGLIPEPDEAAPCLLIDPATTDLSVTPEISASTEGMSIQIDASLNQAGDLTAAETITGTGWLMSAMKAALAQIPGSEMNQFYASFTAGYASKGAKFDSGSVEGVKDPDAPTSIKIKYHVDHFTSDAGGIQVLPSLFPSVLASSELSLLAKDRIYDLDLSSNRVSSSINISIALPPSLKPQKLDAPYVVKDSTINFSMTKTYQDGVIAIHMTDQMSPLRVPVAQVQDYAAKVDEIGRICMSPIILEKN
jgi:tetratricopeptide (TPR) repeat protein